MKVNWEHVPKVKNGQLWKHKITGRVMEVRGRNNQKGRGFNLKNISGGKVHHTSEKDMYIHFYLLK